MSSPAGAAIEVRGLVFRHDDEDGEPALGGLDLTVAAGARCALVGENGAGKTTLLEVLGGRRAASAGSVKLAGRALYVGGAPPAAPEGPVGEMIEAAAAAAGCDGERAEALGEALGVDLRWRLARASLGQRRRVQVMLGLLPPADVLLLDEIAADLDVVARLRLLAFLQKDAAARGATVLHATHVLDGLDGWATHLCLLDRGRVRAHARLEDIKELGELREARVAAPLQRLVERWLKD